MPLLEGVQWGGAVVCCVGSQFQGDAYDDRSDDSRPEDHLNQ